MNRISRKDLFLILLIWLIATALNITKPFHIDDAYHLEAAMHLKQNPLEPGSGYINWFDVPEPISNSNQPPLIFYLITIAGSLFSFTEIPLHLLISLFTLAAIYLFFQLVRLLKPGNEWFLTMLLGFSPAFLVNQNIMTDIPLLAASLAFAFFSLKAAKTHLMRYAIFAGISLGIALLIKFTSLPLLIVLAIIPFFYRKPRYSLVVIIPLIVLSLYSLWNIYEYNDIQLITRTSGRSAVEGFGGMVLSFLACIGAISPFALMLFPTAFKNPKKHIRYILILFGAFSLFVALTWVRLISFDFSKEIIRYVFMLLGIIILINIILANTSIFSDLFNPGFESVKKIFLLLWFFSLTFFIILFAPFIATRHVLLTLPAYLLMLPFIPADYPRVLKTTALTVTLLAGILLSISDYQYANFYKKHARQIAQQYGGSHTIWSLGHWGWQWYSRLNGLKIYHTCMSDVKVGDIFAYPVQVPLQTICPDIELSTLETRWDKPGFLSFFSTRHEATFYNSGYKRPPWRLSEMPTDTIIIQQVTGIKDLKPKENYYVID